MILLILDIIILLLRRSLNELKKKDEECEKYDKRFHFFFFFFVSTRVLFDIGLVKKIETHLMINESFVFSFHSSHTCLNKNFPISTKKLSFSF